MESPTSGVSTTSSSDESFAHNMWNPVMELLFHVQISGAFEPSVDDIDLAKIALSCHFALDLLFYKEGVHDSARRCIGHHCPWIMSFVVRHHCHQTFEQCALTFLRTSAFCLCMVWRTALLSFVLPLSCVLDYIRDLLLDRSRLLGLALRLSRSCLSMSPGILCHAGGRHLRSKPRGTFLRYLFHCVFVSFLYFL